MTPLIDLLESLNNGQSNFRPTEIYNEGWLLRILLNEYSQHPNVESPLKFYPGADWYSEAMLPTRFKARYQGDKQAESRTNADGVIGHIKVGEKGKADLTLSAEATQFTVVEAKMNSSLTKGTKRAPNFDQAARNVACMVEVMNRSAMHDNGIEHSSFILLAPEDKMDKFASLMTKCSIEDKVKNRVYSYEKHAEDNTDFKKYIDWYEKSFIPVFKTLTVKTLSWESAITALPNSDHISNFYKKCTTYN